MPFVWCRRKRKKKEKERVGKYEAEMSNENQAVEVPSNKELLAMAIKELDRVIDYLYAENSEQQAF